MPCAARHLAALGIVVGLTVTAGAPAPAIGAAPPPRSLVCTPPAGSDTLPPTARRGLVNHLPQYPAVGLATPAERAVARRILEQLVASAKQSGWKSVAAARRAGYDMRAPRLRRGDPVRFFHAERRQEPRRGTIFDVTRPKALIFANAPGRPLVLVGAMWSTRDGELGPTPAGPVMRWHSHIVCKAPGKRGLEPPAGGCPAGTRLQQGASEMLHVWFTPDLRSAFAIRAPKPELCELGLLPAGYCKRR